jgi:hypothetical protein
MRTILIIIALATIVPATARSQDRHFAWSYNTPTLPAGNVDVEAWNTYSTGREGHAFSRLGQRLEFEFGVADGVQTSLYLNGTHDFTGPRADDASTAASTSSRFSFSNAWKFHLLSPFDNPLGVSTYLEYYLGQGEVELEGKLMVDHITEHHWWVANTTLEAGFEDAFTLKQNALVSETETEWTWESTLGYMYTFHNGFGVGLEVRNVNAIHDGAWEYAAVYIGPSVFLGGGKFFLIFNLMPQVANLAGLHRPLELDDQERIAFRALLGVSL